MDKEITETYEDTTGVFLEQYLGRNTAASMNALDVTLLSQIVAFDSGDTGVVDCPAIFTRRREEHDRSLQSALQNDLILVLTITSDVLINETPADFSFDDSVGRAFAEDFVDYLDELADVEPFFEHLSSSQPTGVVTPDDPSNDGGGSRDDTFAIAGGVIAAITLVAFIIAVIIIKRGSNDSHDDDSRDDDDSQEDDDITNYFHDGQETLSLDLPSTVFSDPSFCIPESDASSVMPSQATSVEEDSEAEAFRRESSFGSVTSMVTRFTWPGLPAIDLRAHGQHRGHYGHFG